MREKTQRVPKKGSNAISPDVYKRKQSYKRKKKLRVALIALVLCCVAVVLGFIALNFMKIGVIDTLTIEAGAPMVKPLDFFENKDVKAKFYADYDIDTCSVGKYTLKVQNGIMLYKVNLVVEDTVAPTAKVRSIKIHRGEKDITADDFVRNIKDKTKVTAEFERPIDLSKVGNTTVKIILTDEGNNTSSYSSQLTVYPEEIVSSYTVEAGDAQVTIENFLKDGTLPGEDDKILTDLTKLDFHTVGSYDIDILYGGEKYAVVLKVDDTVPPAGYIVNRTTYKGVEIPADSFIKKFYDQTKVTVSYEKKPDFKQVGAFVITVVLTDEGKNETSYRVTLYIKEDNAPPVITAQNRTVYIGDNVRFSQGVTAIDANDGEVKIKIDSSKFDGKTVGSYPITFSAVDKAGNMAEKTVYFTVLKKRSYTYGQWTINNAFEQLYAQIIQNNMTETQKLRAIYNYIRENIAYNGTSDKSDELQEAYRGIRNKQGDSFTYYAVAKKLLTMAGFETKGARRVNNQSDHYWNLVKKDGQWYHFDTCPHYKDYPLDSFMLTDEEVKAYSLLTNGYYEYEEF